MAYPIMSGHSGKKKPPPKAGVQKTLLGSVSLFPPREAFFPHKINMARTTGSIKVTGSDSRLTLSVLPLTSVVERIKFGL